MIGRLTCVNWVAAVFLLYSLATAQQCWWCDSPSVSYELTDVVKTFDSLGRTVRSDSTDFYTGLSSTAYRYDSAGRERCETTFVNNIVTDLKEFTYDTAGNLVRLREPYAYGAGYHVYSYDAMNRLIEECKFANDDFNEYCFTYQYDSKGRKIKMTGSTGWYYVYTYNDHDSLASSAYFPNGTPVSQETYDYQFDSAGRMLQKSVNGAVTVQCQYDQAGRMIRQDLPYLYSTFGYDPVTGNISRTGTYLPNDSLIKEMIFRYNAAAHTVSSACYARQRTGMASYACPSGETCDTGVLSTAGFTVCSAIRIPLGTKLWLKANEGMIQSYFPLRFCAENDSAALPYIPCPVCASRIGAAGAFPHADQTVTRGPYLYRLISFDTAGTTTVLYDRVCDLFACPPDFLRVTVYDPSAAKIPVRQAANRQAISLRNMRNGKTVISVPLDATDPSARIEVVDLLGRIVTKTVVRQQNASMTLGRSSGILLFRIQRNSSTQTVRILSLP